HISAKNGTHVLIRKGRLGPCTVWRCAVGDGKTVAGSRRRRAPIGHRFVVRGRACRWRRQAGKNLLYLKAHRVRKFFKRRVRMLLSARNEPVTKVLRKALEVLNRFCDYPQECRYSHALFPRGVLGDIR